MMRRMCVWILVTLFSLVSEWYGHCYGCLEEERIGLLEIQASFDPNRLFLSDWMDHKDGIANCCEWSGIECDNTTKRVIQLSLKYARYHTGLGDLILNASLFLPFEELQSLNFRGNRLVGLFENQGFEVLSSKLKKLEILDLTANQFNDSILSSLAGLSSLKSLYLSYNDLTGSAGFCGFEVLASKLKKLENLDLSWNKYNDSSTFSSLSGFSSLKSLDLSRNMLKGSTSVNGSFFNSTTLEELFLDYSSLPTNILQNIGALPALRVLSFNKCDLNGTLPTQGLCELKNLEQLYLSKNNLGGLLPACLGNMSSLQQLDVSGNQFTGNIAFGPLTNLISLEFLSLSSNHFDVPLSLKPFLNHSNLKFFICDNNKIIAEPAAFQNFIPKFQLKFLSLSNCLSETRNEEIPNFFYNQYDLRVLDLSHNNFIGIFPSWLLKNNTRLEELLLRENSFVGPLQLQNHPNPNMTLIDISDNSLHGQIPRNMCLLFPKLRSFSMAKNGLIGGIPSCFGNLSSLGYLDLSDNRLSTAKLEQLKTLEFIMLSNNNLGGQVSPLVFNSSTMRYFYLGGNNFRGQISDFQSIQWTHLAALDISYNQFTGILPRWMVNMSLQAIDLSKNRFEGPIPRDFCKLVSLEYLDLSENNLFGPIPSCFNPPSINHVHLSNNKLSGPLTYAFYNSSSLVTLDLRENNFTGSIPNWIGNLSSLSVLLLKANHIDGEFPVQLCLLEYLSILDVSQNKLSGPLPSCLSNLTLKASSKISFIGSGSGFVYTYMTGSPLVERIYNLESSYPEVTFVEVVEFTTKRLSYIYKGNILNIMSGIDLSSNSFFGEIPLEMGNLSEIRALNLSHNNLTGSIPTTFSNLKQIESLDLSYNKLNGGIPLQLTEMTTLEVFSVAHNNLSGKTPERKNQFGTFDESSYEGNPFLCGPPLQNSCGEEQSPSQTMPYDEQDDEPEDDGSIDMDAFYVSFGVCYLIVVLEIAAVLYFNSNLRRRWFYFIEDCIDAYYNFVVNSFCKLSEFKLLLKHV